MESLQLLALLLLLFFILQLQSSAFLFWELFIAFVTLFFVSFFVSLYAFFAIIYSFLLVPCLFCYKSSMAFFLLYIHRKRFFKKRIMVVIKIVINKNGSKRVIRENTMVKTKKLTTQIKMVNNHPGSLKVFPLILK